MVVNCVTGDRRPCNYLLANKQFEWGLIPALQITVLDGFDKIRPSKWIKQRKGPWPVPILNLHHLLVLETSEIFVTRSRHLLRPSQQKLRAQIAPIQRYFICYIHGQNSVFK